MSNSTAHDVASILQSAGFGVIGENIFIEEFDAESVDQIVVINTGGIESEVKDAYEQPTFQILVRGGRNSASLFSYEKIKAVYDRLISLRDTVAVNGTDYEGFEPNGNIIWVGRDENECPVYSANYYTYRNAE